MSRLYHTVRSPSGLDLHVSVNNHLIIFASINHIKIIQQYICLVAFTIVYYTRNSSYLQHYGLFFYRRQ